MRQRDRADLKALEAKRRMIDQNPPHCRLCNKVIPPPRRYHVKVAFCSDAHTKEWVRIDNKEKSYQRRIAQYAKKLSTEEIEAGMYPDDQVRRGTLYEDAKLKLAPGVIEDWIDRKHTEVEIRKMLGQGTYQGLGMVRKALFNDRILESVASGHKLAKTFADMLGPPDKVMATLAEKDTKAYEQKLDQLVLAFVAWRNHFFSTGRGGYITKDVHRRWIRSILDTIYTGGRSLILSPPRHGKTELLIHFCVWLILRNNMIRILWVGPNGDIAENCLGLVKNLLETHTDLIRAYLPPGQTFAPQKRAGNTWQGDKFTVATRSAPQKQPTMWAAGVMGAVLSLDADFIIVDDPADPDKSYTPGGRAKIENWFNVKIMSRKMDFTGLVVIASRVHVLDLFSTMVDHPRWNVLIDKAHDQGLCGLDLHAPHQDETCCLFPELNPLDYLREQHDVVGDALFEMMYLNQPRPDGTLIFDPDIIRTRCLHPSRDLGLAGIHGSFRLIAGLDPAARGVQAAFLWAVQQYDDPRTGKPAFLYHMVDMETQQGGGIEGAHKIMEEWQKKYGCSLWIVEDNAFQSVFFSDLRFRRFLGESGIIMKPTTTGRNKHDQALGLSGMAQDYHDGKVILPYGTIEARRKTDALIRQLVNWTGDSGPTKAGKSDILMASWFPHATYIRRWLKEARAEVVQNPPPVSSYPDYVGGSYSEIPWPAAGYPSKYPETG